jgi:hypothetical protein
MWCRLACTRCAVSLAAVEAQEAKKLPRVGIWVRELTAIYCSTEEKAIDGARILAEHLSLDFVPVAELASSDRRVHGW